jgi:predicted RNase H-like HicB family nuclease
MRYAVVIERGDTSYGAYVPDLSGCVAVAATREEVERLIQEAIIFHLEGMQLAGLPIPEPTSDAIIVDVSPPMAAD